MRRLRALFVALLGAALLLTALVHRRLTYAAHGRHGGSVELQRHARSDYVGTSGSALQFGCANGSDASELLRIERAPFAHGNEKEAFVAQFRNVTMVQKRPRAAMWQKQTPEEVVRRFRHEVNAAGRLGSEFAPLHFGSCFQPARRRVWTMWQRVTPFVQLSDRWLRADVRRTALLYRSQMALFERLARDRLVLCDAHYSQWGVVSQPWRLVLLDFDSLRAHGAHRRLYANVECQRSAQCTQHLHRRRCGTTIRLSGATDTECDRTVGRCHGLDARSNVLASRQVLQRLRNALEPSYADEPYWRQMHKLNVSVERSDAANAAGGGDEAKLRPQWAVRFQWLFANHVNRLNRTERSDAVDVRRMLDRWLMHDAAVASGA